MREMTGFVTVLGVVSFATVISVASWLVIQKLSGSGSSRKVHLLRGTPKPAPLEESADSDLAHPGSFTWGGRVHKNREATHGGILLLAASGAGKTVLADRVVTEMSRDKSLKRFFVLDVKREKLPFFDSIGVPAKTLLFADDRSVRWELSEDIEHADDASGLAADLMPAESRNDPNNHFMLTAQQIVAGLAKVLVSRGGEWRLRDLIWCAAGGADRMTAILRLCPETVHLTEHLGEGSTYGGWPAVRSNIAQAFVDEYLSVAAAWEQATDSVSFRSWVTGPVDAQQRALIMSLHQRRPACTAVNRAMTSVLISYLLEGEEVSEPHTVLYLDELAKLPAPRILDVFDLARSKGVITIVGAQSLKTLEVAHGERTKALLANPRFRVTGRLECPDTAEWVSRHIGDAETEEVQVSHGVSRSAQGSTSSTQWSPHRSISRATLPSELSNIPTVEEAGGIVALYSGTASGGNAHYWHRLPIESFPPRHPSPHIPSYVPRRPYPLEPWNLTDLERLRLPRAPQFLRQSGLIGKRRGTS